MRFRPSARRCRTASSAPPLSSGSRHKRLGILDAREHVDDGQGPHERVDRGARVGAPRGDDEAIDALAHELVDVPALALRIVRRVAHEDRDAVIEQAPLQRRDNRKGEAAEAVVGEDADRHGAGAMQALRETVGPIADLVGDAGDIRARLRAEASAVVERLGGRADRDAGDARDVADRARAALGARLGGVLAHLTAPESRPEM